MPRIRQAAGIVILTRTLPQQCLLMRHKNRWDLPKGHAEPDESLRETALRETTEETGIDAKLIDLDDRFAYEIEYEVDHRKHGRYLKQVTYFLGFVPQAYPVTLTEHVDYRWWDWPLPPIQAQTIDPLLAAVSEYLAAEPSD